LSTEVTDSKNRTGSNKCSDGARVKAVAVEKRTTNKLVSLFLLTPIQIDNYTPTSKGKPKLSTLRKLLNGLNKLCN